MFEGRGGFGAVVEAEQGEYLVFDLLALSRWYNLNHDRLLKDEATVQAQQAKNGERCG